jgi:ABC transporter substrate binding protein (PQQ-dependent alcohol dehydrogenase system)
MVQANGLRRNGAEKTDQGGTMVRWLVAAIGIFIAATPVRAADATEIGIGYLARAGTKPKLSLVELPAENDGLAGARLAIEDNNTTGKFLNQHFTLEEVRLKDNDDVATAATALATRNGFVIADLPADDLLKAADALRDRGTLLLNAGATDDRLREQDCRANVIHVAPTRSMLADALAQYLVWKQWKRWLFVVGSHEQDKLYADALRRAATRFGAKIVQERVFEDTGGARRTDSGVTLIQRQMPVFTQQAPAYDILVAADESEVFAAYLPYRTWDPRPVAGSAGLVATSWHAAQDQWGAIQIQNRFAKLNLRPMTALDMQAWTAARMIGEAASRTKSSDAKAISDFLKGPDFSIAAFKGRRLTLRDWNFQLRQPILLVDGRMVVSVSPQEGFLHQVSELDTLGLDRPETKCRLQ